MIVPSSLNAGFKRGEALDRRVGADPLVGLVHRPVHGDGKDLAAELAAPRSPRAARRCERTDELVHLVARDAPALGDHLGAEALRNEVVALEQLLRKRAAPLLLCAFLDREADAAHVLDAARDDDVVDAGRDPQGAEVDRLLPGAAADVDGRRACALGKPFREPGGSRDAARLLGDLVRAACDDVVDLCGFDARAVEHRLEAAPEQVGGMHVLEDALLRVAAADRRPDGVDDEDLVHRIPNAPSAISVWCSSLLPSTIWKTLASRR